MRTRTWCAAAALVLARQACRGPEVFSRRPMRSARLSEESPRVHGPSVRRPELRVRTRSPPAGGRIPGRRYTAGAVARRHRKHVSLHAARFPISGRRGPT